MKPHSPLLVGLLAASLGCAGAQAAVTPAPVKERVAKARVSKAVKKLARPGRITKDALLPAQVAPQGLPLALSASLREVPPASMAPPAVVPPAQAQAVPSPVPSAATAPAFSHVPYQPRTYAPGGENPYLPKPAVTPAQAFGPIQAVPDTAQQPPPRPEMGNVFDALGTAIPLLPGSGQSLLPTIKKVYPTGEKPMVVVSFKCPTELVGVTPPTIKLLHHLVDLGMDGINKTDLLSFNLQQVCQ
jgi:hypothetical protein